MNFARFRRFDVFFCQGLGSGERSSVVVKIFDSAVKMVQLYRGGCVVLRSVFFYICV